MGQDSTNFIGNELLFPSALYSSLHPAISLPVSASLVLGLYSCDSQILGLKVWAITTRLCFSIRLGQSCVAQTGLELTEICLPLGVGIKGVYHHCLTWTSNWCHSSTLLSSGKLYLLDHKKKKSSKLSSFFPYQMTKITDLHVENEITDLSYHKPFYLIIPSRFRMIMRNNTLVYNDVV